MKRSFLVARREFLENVRTKGFWIGIMMMPVVLVLMIALPIIVESTKEPKAYAVIDQSGGILNRIQQEIEVSDLLLVLKARDLPEILGLAPKAIRIIREHAPELGDTAIRALAEGIVKNELPDANSYPEKLRQQLNLHGPDLTGWWKSLDEESKAVLAPGISSSQFVQELIEDARTESLNKLVQEGKIFAYFIIGSNPMENSDGFKYVSNNLTDRDLLNWFSGQVSKVIQKDRLEQEQIDPETAAWINTPARFEGVQISSDGTEEEVKANDVVRQWAPVAFVYLLWIAILINTQMLLTNTIEEKSNKLIEVLLSSISPLTLMAGKILGIAATGLALIFTWALMIGLLLLLVSGIFSGDGNELASPSGVKMPFDVASILQDPVFLGSFLVYFILGYLFYAALLVGLGSICNNLKEAQNLTLPVQMIQIVPLLIMVPIGRDPNGSLAQILSYVPPFTPFVMMNRAAAPPTTFEYVTTTLLMLVSIILALWFAAKVFRVGILLTGKPPKFREVLRWLRAP